ncbi:hypothetical protein SAMN05216326_1227 [Nitrosomonas marina]|uniref:Uncharacterized protein n=1 Tax=Nitrosomonas marina TaxID=917 RepID=A0A1I0DSN6_9PROT|nr:hypothetical protein SAMN05216326_1227 [Nitrosomonas marina]
MIAAVSAQATVIIRNPRKIDEVLFISPDVKDVTVLLNKLNDFVNKRICKIDTII